MRQYLFVLLLTCLGVLTGCATDGDNMGGSNQENPGAAQRWLGVYAIDVTDSHGETTQTTLKVTGTEMTFSRLPGYGASVTAYYMHTGSSESNEYFDLTVKDDLTAGKWMAVYQKKTGLWSGFVSPGGQTCRFTATKRVR